MNNQETNNLFPNTDTVFFDPDFNRIKLDREEIAAKRRAFVTKLQSTYLERKHFGQNSLSTALDFNDNPQGDTNCHKD